MGSLTSRPKAAGAAATATPQVVYASAPETVSVPSDPLIDEKTSAIQRAENILRRSRSRLGTVLTSFKGILAPSELGTQRKNLLGE